MEGVTVLLLLAQPFGVVTARAAAGDDLEAFLVQTLADGGTDAAMPPVTYASFCAIARSCWVDVGL
jgi:hypothetical protein